MQKNQTVFLLLLFLSLTLQAKPLQLNDQYEVFDAEPININKAIGQQPVYIKFWATWCLECRQELPSLQKTYEKFQKKIAIYAVNLNINETDDFIRQLKQKHNLTIPIVMDNNGSIASNFLFYGTPFHVLINAKGQVVYSTYKDDASLQQQLELLSQPESKPLTLETSPSEGSVVPNQKKGISLLYLSATWCDWYMKDIHPDMAKNCINATQLMNQLYAQNSRMILNAYVTHLWTEEKDLNDYLKKFSIPYKVSIDEGSIARHYRVTQYPTLIVFKNGKEVKRFSQFEDAETISKFVQEVFTNPI